MNIYKYYRSNFIIIVKHINIFMANKQQDINTSDKHYN